MLLPLGFQGAESGPSAGGGGIPAAVLPQSGLSPSDISQRLWKGLLIGLSHEEAGADWRLLRQQRQVATRSIMRLIARQNPIVQVVFTLPAGLDIGTRANRWILRSRSGTAGTVHQDGTNGIFTCDFRGLTVTQAVGQIRSLSTVANADVSILGDGSVAWPAPGDGQAARDYAFGGAVDAEDPEFLADEEAKTVTLKYDGSDTLQALYDLIGDEGLEIAAENLSLFALVLANTDLTASPVAVGGYSLFIESFSKGSLPDEAPQQIGGNWSAGGAGLQLQLAPGNRIDIETPPELLADEQARSVTLQNQRAIAAVAENLSDARRLVGAMNWAVSPSQLSGRAASDFERTFRLQLEPIRFDFTNLYFEIYVEGQQVHDRQQWVSAQHLDVAIDETEAAAIALALPAGQDHVDFHLYFHETSASVPVVAATFRRVLIGGGVDATAREDAGRALAIANQNDALIAALGNRLNAIPNYAATMDVWPPNVAQHSGFQRKFQSTLSGLNSALATDGGNTGTRFANVFRIFTRLSDGTVVQLHTEGWAFTEDDRQTVEWEVSAAEFNAVGATSATNGVEVWGEFRAVYGGGVNELRGRTNPVFIDFGEQDEWPVSRAEAVQAVADASDIGYAAIATTGELDAFLAAQAASKKPRLALFTAAISNHRYQGGPPFNIAESQVRYFKPGSTTGVNFFVLPGGASSGQSAAQVMAAILAALPPFADIRLLPGALPGSAMPDDFYVELSDKLINRTIDGLSLTIQGQTFQPHASTPISGFDTEGQAIVRFDISAQANVIANGINASDRALTVDLTFSFTEGNDYRRRITLPVNNPVAPRLVPEALDTIPFNAALTLDWLSDDMRSVTLTADVTFTFTNIQVGRPIVLEIKQDATGGRGITWPSSVEWAGGAAEGPSSGGGKVDIFTLLPLSKTRVLAVALLAVS